MDPEIIGESIAELKEDTNGGGGTPFYIPFVQQLKDVFDSIIGMKYFLTILTRDGQILSLFESFLPLTGFPLYLSPFKD